MGIFIFIPILFLFAFQLIRDGMKGDWKLSDLYKNYLFTFTIIYFLLFTSFFTWWGGWSYGPRYLIPLGSLLIFEGVRYLAGKKIHPLIYVAFSGYGLFCSWMAKSTLVYMIPDYSGPSGPKPAIGSNPLTDWLIPEFTSGRFNGNTLLSSVFSPQISAFYWLLFFILITGFLVFIYKKLCVPLPVKTVKKATIFIRKNQKRKTPGKKH
ncbi:MAG: hypothetical protein HQ542_03570 [Bacteroidia bacterium]|nr:hypothetical protein [Bacteroidia bacterium]